MDQRKFPGGQGGLPELRKHPIDKIEEFKDIIKNYDIDAICTKVPDVWEK